MLNNDILVALHFSKKAFEKTTGRQPLVFICSQELAQVIGTETIFGCVIEVDECLYSLNDYFWM